MRQEETYYIRKLPKNSIRETSKVCTGWQSFREILEGTFPGIQDEYCGLQIRPKAAFFAEYNEDVYVVLHKEEGKEIECLFFVKFVHSSFYGGIAEVQLCRCLGKHKVKRHYFLVRNNLIGMAHFLEYHMENGYDFTVF